MATGLSVLTMASPTVVHDGQVVAAGGTFEKSGVRRMFVSAFELQDGKVEFFMDEIFEGDGKPEDDLDKASKLAG